MALIASSALIGISLSCLFIPRLGDLYGRKPIFVIALTLQLPVYCLVCFFNKMLPMYITAFFLGPTVTGRMACGFLLMLEMVPKKNQPWAGASLMIAEGLTQIIWTIYFVWINTNAFYFIYFTILINLLALIACLYITESPRYLFGMERYEECRQVLMTIAKRNGVKDYEEPVFNEENIIMVENHDDVIDRINPSGPVSPVGSEDDDATERVGTRLF
jgi:MFS family permease